MIIEYIRYNLTPSNVDAFVAAYTMAAESLRASPHCLGYELTRCSEAPETFTLRIEWDSAEGHMQGFRSSQQFKTFLMAVKPFVKDIQEMRHYDLTELRWSR